MRPVTQESETRRPTRLTRQRGVSSAAYGAATALGGGGPGAIKKRDIAQKN